MPAHSDELRRFLASATASVRSLDELTHAAPAREARVDHCFGLDQLRGRLVEISARGAAATLTTAVELVAEAQQQSEPVAWIARASGTFYPPDVADSGVDLAALVVVRVADGIAAARAAERLLRSGAFGLVVLDVDLQELSIAAQGRLVTLAQAHDATIACLTRKPDDAASLGSLVSLRAEALRRRGAGDFEIAVRVLKDKRRGPGWTYVAKRRGPIGL
jgi:recombination protein RecA